MRSFHDFQKIVDFIVFWSEMPGYKQTVAVYLLKRPLFRLVKIAIVREVTMFNYRRLAIAALVFGSISWGHLDSLKINSVLAGTKAASTAMTDSFTIGQQISFTYMVLVAHNGTRIYHRISHNNGVVWDTISSTTNVAAGLKTFVWTVTGPVTNMARIRIFHSASPNPEGIIPNDYTLYSGQFGINAASSLRPIDFSKSLYFRQTTNSILVGYVGNTDNSLRLEINDLTGALLRDIPLFGQESGGTTLMTSSLPQGRIFLRVMSGDKSLTNRSLMIRR